MSFRIWQALLRRWRGLSVSVSGRLSGALLSMATFTNAWPMLISIAFCATCSIFLLALRIPAAKNRTLGHIFRGEIAPFLMHVNRNGLQGSAICFLYVKSISVKSRIVAIKKLVLDHRNGYI